MRTITFFCISSLALLMINCGGGGGNSSSSSSSSPGTPAISSLTPSSATATGLSFTIVINGSNFSSGCLGFWNGSARTTTYVSSSRLNLSISDSDISDGGSYPISVSCSGSVSNSLSFLVSNPTPVLSSVSPSSAIAGANNFTLTVSGSGFVRSSSVQWNSSSRTSSFVSSTTLNVSISHSDVASSGIAVIKVVNPPPSGGTSSSLGYIITPLQALTISTNRLPDAVHNKTYAYDLQASGGIPPYTWSLVSGALPSGLSLISPRITGTPPTVSNDTNYSFGLMLVDSGYQPSSLTKNYSLRVRSGSLARNDTCATATAITNGTIRASISPYGDVDVYSFQGNISSTVAIQTYAERLGINSQLDSFLEILDSSCNRLAYNDDINSGVTVDSSITYTLPYTGVYYIRVSDLRGDGRPDFIYDLSLSGAN
jgi:hypothetical protein